MMTLEKIEKYFIVYQEQGNDKNGNPLFLINIFNDNFTNLNYLTKQRRDKYGNIKMSSYCMNETIKYLLKKITQ